MTATALPPTCQIILDWLSESLEMFLQSRSRDPNLQEMVKQNGLVDLIKAYAESSDHGVEHSQVVWRASLWIFRQAPQATAAVNELIDGFSLQKLLAYPAIFHDLARFLNLNSREHQEHESLGAKLAFNVLRARGVREEVANMVWCAVVNHDYFSPTVDGRPVPVALLNPFADAFRLADKTSLTPAGEIKRYYLTGVRYGTPFFNPDLTDEQRFDFPHNLAQRDMITWFLLVFALKPEDFLFTETREIYRFWSKRKDEAEQAILKLAKEQARCQPACLSRIENIIRTFRARVGV